MSSIGEPFTGCSMQEQAPTSQSTHVARRPFSSYLTTHSLGAKVTMFLWQIDRGVDRLVVALLLTLRHGAAGATEQAWDPLAGRVLHHLAARLLQVAGGAGDLGVVSTLLQSFPCATLLQGPVALSHLDLYQVARIVSPHVMDICCN